jgi:hypothetical protein
MATIETSAEVLEVGSTWVRLRIGAEGHQQGFRLDLSVRKDAQGFSDAMERGGRGCGSPSTSRSRRGRTGRRRRPWSATWRGRSRGDPMISAPRTGIGLVASAAGYAAYAHRHQRRKTSGHPYVVHPARVALRLWRCGWRDPEVLAASLLHDVNEDTPHVVASSVWPARVVHLVLECSERKHSGDGSPIPWLARKAALLRSCEVDRDVAAIKASDLADNLSDCARHGWGGISVGPEQYGVYARGLLALVDGDLARELRGACGAAGVRV